MRGCEGDAPRTKRGVSWTRLKGARPHGVTAVDNGFTPQQPTPVGEEGGAHLDDEVLGLREGPGDVVRQTLTLRRAQHLSGCVTRRGRG